MNLLPEWAPNVHPLIVHFPIAVLIVAILADVLALFVRRQSTRIAAASLYALGALGVLASYLTGRDAADGMDLPASVIPAVTDHADWAELTLWFFGIYALVRLVLLGFDLKGKAWVRGWLHVLVVLVGAGGYYLVVQTGDHGGQLVFAHGVGVQAQAEEAPPTDGPPVPPGEAARVQHTDDGWQWAPGAGARQVLAEDFRFVQSSLDALSVDASADDSAAAITLHDGPVLFTAGEALASIQAEATVDVSQFDGTLRLVHHVQGPHDYDFLAVEDGQMRQGRVEGGDVQIFDERPVETSGWIDMQAVSDGTHFRGYVNGEMLTHGHGEAPEPGAVGLYLDGRGTVRLQRLSATSLR